MASTTLAKLHDPEALLRFCGVDRGGLYHCPYRHDKKPSFSIFQGLGNKKYIWQDKSDGTSSTGGDLIHLVMVLYDCDKSEAFRRIAKWDGSPQINLIKARGRGGYSAKLSILKSTPAPAISKVATASEKSLIQRRHYSEARYLRQYQLELPEWVAADLKAYTAGPYNNLVYSTVAGSQHIRNIDHYASWPGGDIQTFSVCGNPESTIVTVTEGIGDFLSLLAMSPDYWRNTRAPGLCHIVLNSTDCIPKAIFWLQSREIKPTAVWAGLDYGSGGDTSTLALVAAFPGAVDIRPRLIPNGIEGVKDLRDAYNFCRGLRH